MNNHWIKMALFCALMSMFSACSDDNDSQKENECEGAETKCVSDNDTVSVYACVSSKWVKSDAVCEACDASGKECKKAENESTEQPPKECNNGEQKCEDDDGNAVLYACILEQWSKLDVTCDACDSAHKSCLDDSPQGGDPEGDECVTGESKCTMDNGVATQNTCENGKWSKAVCTLPGAKTIKCSDADGAIGSTCITDSCEDGLTMIQGNCVDSNADLNNNHMRDIYETAVNQGKSCHYYKDCDSAEGADDGFCDSFINYQCSTKCTENAQCLDGFICRPDGRCAPKAFEMVWQVPSDGMRKTFNVSTDSNDYTVDWGDGSEPEHFPNGVHDSSMGNDMIVAHKYEKQGTYTIKVSGGFNRVSCGLRPDCELVKEIKAFGPAGMTNSNFSMSKGLAFSKIDIPDATKLTKLFTVIPYDYNSPLEHWDVSYVTDMSSAFDGNTVFNQPLNRWDTHRVTTMKSTFANATAFNQPIDQWDVSQVKSIGYMFYAAKAFNQPLNSWNVENVTYMSGTFNKASSFNQPLDQWNTSKVKELENTFDEASSFDQDLSGWNLMNVVKFASFIFSNSGLSKENYCKIKNSPTWSGTAKNNLGISGITCD